LTEKAQKKSVRSCCKSDGNIIPALRVQSKLCNLLNQGIIPLTYCSFSFEGKALGSWSKGRKSVKLRARVGEVFTGQWVETMVL